MVFVIDIFFGQNVLRRSPGYFHALQTDAETIRDDLCRDETFVGDPNNNIGPITGVFDCFC